MHRNERILANATTIDETPPSGEVRGLCYGVKREAASRSGTSQNPQNTHTKSNTNPKTQITCSNSVRGRLLGYAQNRSCRTKYLRFVNRLIELQFLSFIACKTKCEHNSNTCLFIGTSNVSKILTDNVRESQVRAP